jgi:hypothetical protein
VTCRSELSSPSTPCSVLCCLTPLLSTAQIRHTETLASSDRRAVVWTSVEVVMLGGLSVLQMVLFRYAFKNY